MTKDDFIYALKTCEYTVHNGQVMYAEEDLIKRFSDLPSRPQGHWEKITDCGKVLSYQCTCGCAYRNKFNYCPNCGAKME